jgi:PST family polysaccharide transporter
MADRNSFFGAVALFGAMVVKLLLQMLVLPILARILGPSAYGLVGIALPFILLANMLCDAGLAAALARERTVSQELESTIFWISAALSTGMSLILCVAAWPLARLFHEPELAPILASLTLVLLLSATLSVSNARITRAQKFSIFAIGDVAASIVGAGAAIAAAFNGLGAWSLVVQQLVFWIVKFAWLFPVAGFRPAWRFDFPAATPHLRFGANMVGASWADFASKNLPVIIVAGALGTVGAGQFGLANQLGRLPEILFAGPLFLPIFSAVARAQADGASLPALVNRMLRIGVTVLAPLYCGWAFIADIALPLILGPKWHGADVLMQIVAPASFAMCVIMLFTAVLQGIGRSDVQFRLWSALAVTICCGSSAGHWFGVRGAVAGVVAGTLVMTPFYFQAVCRQLGATLAALLAGCAQPIAATVVMGLVLAVIRRWTPGLPDVVELAILIPAGAVVFAVALLALSHERVLDDVRALRPSRA